MYFLRIDFPSIQRHWENISLIYNDQYHDYNELQEEIYRLINLIPDLINFEIIGQSIQNLNITCVRVTNQLDTVQKAKTLVVAHHHGREQITVEVALRFILYLINNYGLNEVITNYIDTQEIFIIPTLNPDSLEYVVNQGNHWLRKNLHPYDNDNDTLIDEDPVDDVNGDGIISVYDVYIKSPIYNNTIYQDSYFEGLDNDGDGLINEDRVGLVDLGRNYATYWKNIRANGWSENVKSDLYPGLFPFSEPETQVFNNFVSRHKFGMAYDLHSGINQTLFPTDLDGVFVEDLYRTILAELKPLIPYHFPRHHNYYEIFPYKQFKNVLLASSMAGAWAEWMYFEQGTLIPISFEIFNNKTSVFHPDMYSIVVDNSTHYIIEWKGIFWHYNPEKEYIDALWDYLTPAFNYLLNQTPRLRINPISISGGSLRNDDITLQIKSKNLSPHIGTIEGINILTETRKIISTKIPLAPNKIGLDTIKFKLPIDLDQKDLTIKIGNNYTGFKNFIIGISKHTTSQIMSNSSVTTTIMNSFVSSYSESSMSYISSEINKEASGFSILVTFTIFMIIFNWKRLFQK
ncbi:MAG: M14 family zinc carboxypeptidase [Candidatus Hodarchaeales archaeon]